MLIGGCELFEPRDSETPITEGEGNWLPPLNPTAVIHNWQEAVSRLDRSNYMTVYSDENWPEAFRFYPDASHAGTDEMQNWNRDTEFLYWDNLVAHMEGRGSFARHDLTYTSTDSMLFGDSAIVSGTYDFILEHGLHDMPERFFGHMTLAFSRHLENGDWAITRCEDESVDSLASWSVLRSEFFLWQ
jgi:hypothetical protein